MSLISPGSANFSLRVSLSRLLWRDTCAATSLSLPLRRNARNRVLVALAAHLNLLSRSISFHSSLAAFRAARSRSAVPFPSSPSPSPRYHYVYSRSSRLARSRLSTIYIKDVGMWNGLSSYASDAIGVAVWPCRLSLDSPIPLRTSPRAHIYICMCIHTYTYIITHLTHFIAPCHAFVPWPPDSCTTDPARRIPRDVPERTFSQNVYTRNLIIQQPMLLLPKVIFVFFLASHSRFSRGLIVPLGNSVTIAALSTYYVIFAWRGTKRLAILHMTYMMHKSDRCIYTWILRSHYKINKNINFNFKRENFYLMIQTKRLIIVLLSTSVYNIFWWQNINVLYLYEYQI